MAGVPAGGVDGQAVAVHGLLGGRGRIWVGDTRGAHFAITTQPAALLLYIPRADLEGRPGLAGRAPEDQTVLGSHEEAVVLRRLIVHGQRHWRREEGTGRKRVAMCVELVVIR